VLWCLCRPGAITVTCLQPSFILHVSLLHGLCVGPVLLDAAENSVLLKIA
jgi:hypothetical protein